MTLASTTVDVDGPADRLDADTDLILAYYHQFDAQDPPPTTNAAPRRTSIPSQGGTDRRRLAIVERKPSEPANTTIDLALVAPPDASPLSYSALTPPRTPQPASKPRPCITVDDAPSGLTNRARRSPSDALAAFPRVGHVPRKSSREVAIVGTANSAGSASLSQQPPNTVLPATDPLRPPLFQIPQSRSPSPGVSDISDSGCSTSRGRQRKDALAPGVSPIRELKELSTPVRTPNIGESKRITDRVAGPVVINLFPQSPSPSPVFSTPPSSAQDLMSPRTVISSPSTPSTALTSPVATPSPYLYYQPGLHATAGPLPQPPQAIFTIDPKNPAPPRPPRHSPIRRRDDLEAMKQALQLPSHVSAALSAKSSSPSTEKEFLSTNSHKVSIAAVPSPATAPRTASPQRCAVSTSHRTTVEREFGISSHDSLDSHPKPHHVREGAFSPSRTCTLDSEAPREEIATSLPRLDSMDDLVASIGLAIDDMGIINSSDVPPPTIVEPPRGHEGPNGGKGLKIRRSGNLRFGLSRSPSSERHHADPSPSSPRSDESAAQSWVDPDRTITRSPVPPVPAKNELPHLDTKLLRNALNIKRFSSLPRTPSLMSLNRPSFGSKRSSGTPSPSVAHSVLQPKLPVRRTKSAHPPAMFFADVTVKRTPLERSIGYAYKINELCSCDCGLGDWVAETRYKALHPNPSTKRSTVNSSRGARAPSTCSPSIAPRHISQSSTDSGVTFPIRPDAYSATDLASRTAGDASPPNAPPPLPYPALAAAAPRSGPSRASTMIATSSTSSSRSAASPSIARSPGSFFASLGRRASTKKEKPSTPPSPPKKLSRSPPRSGNEQSTPRPANPPTVPGGPRAPPYRMKRSQTIILTAPGSTTEGNPQRCTSMARRPSLFDGRNSGSTHHHNASISGADFNRQVDKLAALLPRADRNVLAVYLQRTGHDMLAIGQYLEDEKNGALRYE